jgi:hypothetical protein
LQSKFTLLQSKSFPAKIPFSKIQKKNLAGKDLLCEGTRSILNITISRSLPIETNIWIGHKNKGEVSKNEGGISKKKGKITPSIEPRNGE